MIRVTGLHKRYGPIAVLDDLHARLDGGETAVLVGPSGSGKTTFLRCLCGLEDFEQGEIVRGGLRLHPDMSRAERRAAGKHREKVAIVFQQFLLFPHLTALQNVALAPRLVRGLPHREALQEASSLLERVGLTGRADAYASELSGGQQQRVAIARALSQRPEFLLFDEPTSALDPEHRSGVLDIIRSLKGEGITMVVVTHDPEVYRVADVLWYMSRGQITEERVSFAAPEGRRSAV